MRAAAGTTGENYQMDGTTPDEKALRIALIIWPYGRSKWRSNKWKGENA